MRKHWGALGLIAAVALTANTAHAQFTRQWVTTLPFHQRLDAPEGAPATPNDDIRGVAFNKNPGSPYYGYAYLCFRATPAPGAVAYNKILIYQPDAAAAKGVPSYSDTGLSITTPDNANFSAMGVSIGSDDTVWVADYPGRRILKAPPVPPSGVNVEASPVINLADFDLTALAMLPAAITDPGSPRNVVVSGTADNATVVVCNQVSATKRSIEHFTVSGSTVTFNWAYAPLDVPGNTYSQANSCVDAAIDNAGNVYVPLAARADQETADVTIVKLSSAGVVDTSFAPKAPVPAGPADYPAIAYVPNASAPGGGYLFWEGSRGSNNSANIYQYDMTGALVDAYGVDTNGNPLGLGKNILGANIVEVFSADGDGNLYHRYGKATANANIFRISMSPPAISAGAYSKSSPTALDGVVYFASGDGNLYAVDTTTGAAVDGFPVNVETLTGDAGAVVPGRPTIRIPAGQAASLFAVTSTARVIRLPVTGDTGAAWVSAPLIPAITNANATPAVTDTAIYVAIGNGTDVTLFKLDINNEAAPISVNLVDATKVLSSPAVTQQGNIYVTTDVGTFRVTDNGSALTVQTYSGGDTTGSPFVDVNAPTGPTMYVAENAGYVTARNATTFNPETAFGGGSVLLTDGATNPALATGPFALNGKVYVGALDNKVYALNEADGSGAGPAGSMVFFDGNAVGIPVTGGWRITRDVSAAPGAEGGWNIVFGSRGSMYYQVRENDPTDYHVTPVGNVNKYAVDSVPAIDRATNSEFVGVDNGFIFKIPAF